MKGTSIIASVNILEVDLNLLRLFDVVFRTRNVGRAAEVLGFSQPTASQGLTRLRLLIKDPLFVRSLGGVTPPGGIPAVRYTQAMLAITSQHRLSGGVGFSDVLPGVDLDFMAGGMFHDDAQLGASTATSIESYWVGAGLTWAFDRCCARKSRNACDGGCE